MDPTRLADLSFLGPLLVGGIVAVIWGFVWFKTKGIGLVDGFFSIVMLSSLLLRLDTVVVLALAAAAGFVAFRVAKKQGEPAPLAFAWMCAFATLIAGISNTSGSPGHLHEQIAAFFHMSLQAAWNLVVFVRKVIHFSAYGSAALAAYKWSEANDLKGLWRGIAFTLPLSVFDEFRQHFSKGREGSPYDVILDMSGAVTFLVVCWLVSRKRDGKTAP